MDISSAGRGGRGTALVEMCFPSTSDGYECQNWVELEGGTDLVLVQKHFSLRETQEFLSQLEDNKAVVESLLFEATMFDYGSLPTVTDSGKLNFEGKNLRLDVAEMRDVWLHVFLPIDRKQSGERTSERLDLTIIKKQPSYLHLCSQGLEAVL